MGSVFKGKIMSAPTYIFIDTGIFDEQNYNFNSTAFNAFLMAIKKQGLKLVLPDPTLREIERHIAKRACARQQFMIKNLVKIG
jgi:hypothetical protein